MTPQLVHDAGTHTFHQGYGKVFNATLGALKSEGYPIATSAPDTGLIKTGQRSIRVVAYGSRSSAVAMEITRQYVVHVTKSADGTVVQAEPRVFQGTADLSNESVWAIDGPEGERALWQRLFLDIQEAM